MSKGSPKAPRKRLDLILVERAMAESREKAQALILSGRVSAGGRRLDKPGAAIPADTKIQIADAPRWVGRGGEKLDGALAVLGLDVTGMEVLDVGASTGGFTDCLLRRGAAHVTALDVGRGQLDWTLRNDARVTPLEGINVRLLSPGVVPGPFDLIVVDVSFISLRLVVPVLVARLGRISPGGEAAPHAIPLPAILALVKPQFEVGRGKVGKGGIVRDPHRQFEAVLDVLGALCGVNAAGPGDGSRVDAPARHAGPGLFRIIESPIRGAEGNREFFVVLVPGYDRAWPEVEAEVRTIVLGSVMESRS